jgi:hypothetical protein
MLFPISPVPDHNHWLTGTEAAAYGCVRAHCFSGHGKARSQRIHCPALRDVSGDSFAPTLMVCSPRHPLALLKGGSIESTATRNRVCALRQTAPDLELPVV